jgi:hypothetical protein
MSETIDPPSTAAGSPSTAAGFPSTAAGTASATAPKDTVQRLKPNAVGLLGVLFMAIATAAPITAMVGNVPIAVGFGNGAYAPAAFIVATIVLTLFAIG